MKRAKLQQKHIYSCIKRMQYGNHAYAYVVEWWLVNTILLYAYVVSTPYVFFTSIRRM